jgi:UDP-glucose 4-epimerase
MQDHLEYYIGKTILVTGSTGFIGSSVVKALSRIDCTLFCCMWGDGMIEVETPTKARIHARTIDIRSPYLWDEVLDGVDVVFHFAAQTSSKSANENPLEDVEVNSLPVARFINICQTKGIYPDFIFPGTVTQVGMTTTCPVDETVLDVPITIYDINKLTVEKYLHYYCSQMGGRAVTLRLANVYGPGPKSSRPDRGVLNMMVIRALSGEPLTVYGEGEYIRDYIFIDDVLNAFLIAGATLHSTKGKHYVLGSGTGHTIKEMVETVSEITGEILGKTIEVKSVPMPEQISHIEYRHFVANTTRFRSDTGWTPQVSLREGVRHTIQFFLGQEKS